MGESSTSAAEKAAATSRQSSIREGHGSAEPELFEAVPTRDRRVPTRSQGRLLLAARVLGAFALLATGAVHLQQFTQLYSQIPTIGTLFVLNFVGATVIGLGLLVPLERTGGRHASTILVLLASAGTALAAAAFISLLISEHASLFGFTEPGYDPPAIAAARAAEVATVLCLGAFLVGRAALKAPTRRW
jgi:hypothetical protein